MQLKRKDIMFFENILDYVEENDDLEEKDVERYTLEFISKNNIFFKSIHENINDLYKKYDLKYDAEINPFI